MVDEAHAYRGVFGCHTALILRRLRRLLHHCTFLFSSISSKMHSHHASADKLKVDNGSLFAVYGAEPNFIVCSATVANPREHAMVFSLLTFFSSAKCV